MSTRKKNEIMTILHPFAAGIDVGAKSHFIAVGQKPEDVKEFGVNTTGHLGAIEFLNSHHIKTIAMESTGSYWQCLFSVLQEAGFEVLLVPGNQTKNGIKKTDVKDCQWIQKLHMLGLLTGCFFTKRPSIEIKNFN